MLIKVKDMISWPHSEHMYVLYHSGFFHPPTSPFLAQNDFHIACRCVFSSECILSGSKFSSYCGQVYGFSSEWILSCSTKSLSSSKSLSHSKQLYLFSSEWILSCFSRSLSSSKSLLHCEPLFVFSFEWILSCC